MTLYTILSPPHTHTHTLPSLSSYTTQLLQSPRHTPYLTKIPRNQVRAVTRILGSHEPAECSHCTRPCVFNRDTSPGIYYLS